MNLLLSGGFLGIKLALVLNANLPVPRFRKERVPKGKVEKT